MLIDRKKSCSPAVFKNCLLVAEKWVQTAEIFNDKNAFEIIFFYK